MRGSHSSICSYNPKASFQYKEDKECKLEYVLTLLGLENLIPRLISLKLTFKDLLLLSKQDIIQLNFDLVQRNRLLNFIQSFHNIENDYTFEEIIYFFNQNRQFIFIQIQQPITYERACIIVAKYINDNQINSTNQHNTPLSQRENSKECKADEHKQILRSDCKNKEMNIKPRHQYKEKSSGSIQSIIQQQKKELIHSQTADPYLKKSKTKENPYYQNYLLINKESENILTSLKKSREETETKHLKYALLLNNSNKDSNGIKNSINNHISNEISNTKEESLQQHPKHKLCKVKECDFIKDDVIDTNKANEDINKLYDIINRKEALKKHLCECNKSITEKKKILAYLNEDNYQKDSHKTLKKNNENGSDNIQLKEINSPSITTALQKIDEGNEYESKQRLCKQKACNNLHQKAYY